MYNKKKAISRNYNRKITQHVKFISVVCVTSEKPNEVKYNNKAQDLGKGFNSALALPRKQYC